MAIPISSWPHFGQILRYQYGISFAKAQTYFLLANVPSGEEQGEMAVFAGYALSSLQFCLEHSLSMCIESCRILTFHGQWVQKVSLLLQVSLKGIKVHKQENQGSNYCMGLQCIMNKTVHLLTIKKHPPPQKKKNNKIKYAVRNNTRNSFELLIIP